MKILGVDTSTQTGSVALIEEERLLAELTLNIKETHESRLLKSIDLVFQSCHLIPQDVDLFAVSVGPGSFTGLRIGLATLKALSQAANKPIVGVSSLEAMSYNFRYVKTYLCPLLDARKGEIFAALFHWEKENLKCDLADQVSNPQDFLREVKKITGNEPVLFWGSGCLYVPLITEVFSSQAIFPPISETGGRMIAYLGFQKWQKTQTNELWQLLPNYLRKSEAELKNAPT